MVGTLLCNLHLFHDLVRSKKVISVEPLDVRSLREFQGLVSGRCCARVRLAYNLDGSALKGTRDIQRAILGSIINHYDFDLRPSLGKR